MLVNKLPTTTTYDVNDAAFSDAASAVLDLCQTASDIKLSENYTEKRLRFDDAIAISLYRNGDDVVGFSTVLYLPIFNDSVRILNRFYRTEDYRGHSHKTVLPETKVMVSQQVEVAERYDYKVTFMSREGTSPPAMRYYTRQLEQSWEVSPHRHQVCEAACAECWQSVAFHSLKTGIDPYQSLPTYMVTDQFRTQFHNELL